MTRPPDTPQLRLWGEIDLASASMKNGRPRRRDSLARALAFSTENPPVFGTYFAFSPRNQASAAPAAAPLACLGKGQIFMESYSTAEQFLPPRMNLKALREAARNCRGCDLYRNSTHVVFGAGPRRAKFFLLGEMPGDEEDKQGKPFVGPAGKLLEDALQEIGLSRSKVYVTNAVKHFRWEPRGKRRLHKKPSARQIEACRPWLHAEILLTKPDVIVCLGATAAQAMLGRDFRITRHRGKFFKKDDAAWLLATYHPAAILRAPEKTDRDRMRREFIADLRRAARRLHEHAASTQQL